VRSNPGAFASNGRNRSSSSDAAPVLSNINRRSPRPSETPCAYQLAIGACAPAGPPDGSTRNSEAEAVFIWLRRCSKFGCRKRRRGVIEGNCARKYHEIKLKRLRWSLCYRPRAVSNRSHSDCEAPFGFAGQFAWFAAAVYFVEVRTVPERAATTPLRIPRP
jgi:hypothetical protein